ncbi:MAG: hypothetical protein Q4C54_07435 [Clostridia bacterium]|nr:hypothetical protein [Clostridia bacterium]
MTDPYASIRHLPHHESRTHPPMSMHDRAAQFSPFAALTGYDDEVREAGRLTLSRAQEDDEALLTIDRRLRTIAAQLESQGETPPVTVSYFVPDEKKDGGRIEQVTAPVKKLRLYERQMVLCSGQAIPMDDIVLLEGVFFPE